MRRIVPIHGHFKMRHMWRVAVLALGLAGCQMGGTDKAPGDVAAASAITGPAVEVTTLAPMGSAAAAGPVAATTAVGPVPDGVPAPEKPAPKNTVPEVATPANPAAAKPASPPAPVIVKTPSQIACEKRGGSFVVVGKSGGMTCQMPTRDGGKQCSRESDCDGVCLARSNTCAPVKPLLGCQAILQNDGRRVELCID